MEESIFPQLSELMHNRRFTLIGRADRDANARTVYQYFVYGDEISGSFRGGVIVNGMLYGRARGPESIELLYHCTTTEGEDLAGWSRGTVKVAEDGRTVLHMAWDWLASVTGSEEPTYSEIVD